MQDCGISSVNYVHNTVSHQAINYEIHVTLRINQDFS